MKGWFKESHPHALAARGVKLGREKRKSNIKLSKALTREEIEAMEHGHYHTDPSGSEGIVWHEHSGGKKFHEHPDGNLEDWISNRKSFSKKDPLGGLWKAQYAPREKAIKGVLKGQALKDWNKSSLGKKISVIDRLQTKGYFDEMRKEGLFSTDQEGKYQKAMDWWERIDDGQASEIREKAYLNMADPDEVEELKRLKSDPEYLAEKAFDWWEELDDPGKEQAIANAYKTKPKMSKKEKIEWPQEISEDQRKEDKQRYFADRIDRFDQKGGKYARAIESALDDAGEEYIDKLSNSQKTALIDKLIGIKKQKSLSKSKTDQNKVKKAYRKIYFDTASMEMPYGMTEEQFDKNFPDYMVDALQGSLPQFNLNKSEAEELEKLVRKAKEPKFSKLQESKLDDELDYTKTEKKLYTAERKLGYAMQQFRTGKWSHGKTVGYLRKNMPKLSISHELYELNKSIANVKKTMAKEGLSFKNKIGWQKYLMELEDKKKILERTNKPDRIFSKEYIKGGLAEGKSSQIFKPKQLKKGIEVELEHTKSRRIAKEIAKDHLVENSKYYDKLEKAKLSKPKATIIGNQKRWAIVDKDKIVSKHKDFYLAQMAVDQHFKNKKITNNYEIVSISELETRRTKK